jgi:hypothetical protein
VTLASLLRIVLGVAALYSVYFLIPTKTADGGPYLWAFLLQLLLFGAVGAIQLPAIINSHNPVARAVEALALTMSLFLFSFARIYLTSSLYDPGAFSERLDRTGALYFTVTVLSTVGFGDIVPEGHVARQLVTLQMLLNLAILGAGIRLLLAAARRGVARRRDTAAPGLQPPH